MSERDNNQITTMTDTITTLQIINRRARSTFAKPALSNNMEAILRNKLSKNPGLVFTCFLYLSFGSSKTCFSCSGVGLKTTIWLVSVAVFITRVESFAALVFVTVVNNIANGQRIKYFRQILIRFRR